MIRNLAAFWADVLLGLHREPRCPLCGWGSRGPRSLAAHVGRHGVKVK